MALLIGRSLLSKRLKEARRTQVELAEYLGVTQPFISKIARNKRIFSLEMAADTAHFLGCSIHDLYTWVEVPLKDKRL